MTNKEFSRTFRLVASLMELHGENKFKIRSYSNAGFNINRLGVQLSEVPFAEMDKLQGVGKTIAAAVQSLLTTGSFPLLDAMVAKTPAGVMDVIKLKGLGAKKVKLLWDELGIESLGELLYACNENRLVALKGFGAKTQENIRKSIEYLLANADKYYYAALESEAEDLMKSFEAGENEAIAQVSVTGEMRRRCEILEAIEIIVACADSAAVLDVCKKEQVEVEEQNESFLKGHTVVGTPVIIHLSKPENFAQRLFETTGSAAHIADIQAFIKEDIAAATEEIAIYKAANLPYILPELREGRNEIALAQQNALPDLVTVSDIKGVVHAHTTYSDGSNTLKDLATHCKNVGFEYLAVSDHSKSAFYAGGLKVADIVRQHAEIDRLNKQLAPFKIFKGIESDILYDGSLDYEDDVLASFDFIIASVHSVLKMTQEKAMERLIKAIENPYTTILGHPTGRLLLSREGYPIDHKKVIDACAANGVVMELNANPYRLDIDWRWIYYCLEKGVKVSVNPDAHSIAGVSDIKYGIFAARKGLLTSEMTFNAQGLEKISAYFKKK